jgi:hypothetical protein
MAIWQKAVVPDHAQSVRDRLRCSIDARGLVPLAAILMRDRIAPA